MSSSEQVTYTVDVRPDERTGARLDYAVVPLTGKGIGQETPRGRFQFEKDARAFANVLNADRGGSGFTEDERRLRHLMAAGAAVVEAEAEGEETVDPIDNLREVIREIQGEKEG